MKKHTFVILAYQESDNLEDCIKSILKQSVKSNVLIATSTPNDFIFEMASKYSLGVTINEQESNKGSDYNFALDRVDSELVTIAHQDDLYDRNYTKEIIKKYEQNLDATIIFTDNYEINNDKKIKKNKRLRKQRHFLWPLKFKIFENKKHFKLRALRKNKFICTSSITFVKKNIKEAVFPTNLIYDNDWQGLINLAKDKTKFVYLDKKLVGYRRDNILFDPEKIEEDKDILKSMYPKWYYEKIIKRKFEKM